MKDQELANIAYILVHDFQIEMIESGRGDIEFQDGDTPYRDCAVSILNWATEYPEIASHARTVLEWIDADHFDIDSV